MIVVHRCVTCRHPDVLGKAETHPVLGLSRPDKCGQGNCCRKCQWDPEPEVMRRYHDDGTPVVEVAPPGTAVRFYTAGTTCSCQACQNLYAQLTTQKESTQ